MAAFAEIQKGLTRKVPVLDGEWFYEDTRPAEKHIALATGIRPDLTFNHYAEFDEVGNADQAAIRVMNELSVAGGFGLPEKDGSKRGSVQNHFGRPCSSYRNSA